MTHHVNGSGPPSLGQWLTILLPTGRGLLAVLQAYFDESERQSQLLTVAGFAFEPVQVRKFEREWTRDVAHDRVFHMVDVVALREAFQGLSRSDSDRLIQKAVKTINRRLTAAVIVSCRQDQFYGLAPKGWIEHWGHAYTICAHTCMVALGQWALRKGRTDGIAYIFEAGHRHVTDAHRLMRHASGTPLGVAYQYRSHAFVQKRDAVPLQAADLLAWEWGKFYDETWDRLIWRRPIRGSLRALIERDPKLYHVHHLNPLSLMKFFEKTQALSEPGGWPDPSRLD